MAIFFTADTHFSHKNFARGTSTWQSGYRDFDTAEEMNQQIIDNINAVVGEKDVLYHLGDFAWGHIDNVRECRTQINCQNIHLILGNHDGRHARAIMDSGLFLTVQNYKEVKHDGEFIVLCHYPFSSWNRSHYGSWHLHGHVHGRFVELGFMNRRDVGVDTNELRPYSFDDIRKALDT